MIDEVIARKLVASVPHWHHKFEIVPGIVTPGTYDPEFLWEKINLPMNLVGKRALDIGSSDGFFSRELHRRGAEVVCIDYRAKTEQRGFSVMERLYGHSFEFHHLNLYDIDTRALGRFDIVLFLGVLYHLPDMVRALSIVRSLSRGSMFLESHCENEFCKEVAAARYYEAGSLGGDWTNFWAPNRLCVIDMLRDTGFTPVSDESWGQRILVEATINEAEDIHLRKMQTAYGLVHSMSG